MQPHLLPRRGEARRGRHQRGEGWKERHPPALGLITYQRTVTTVSPDPKLCFYNVRGWQDTKQLLNELHKKHSQSSQLDELKAALTQE